MSHSAVFEQHINDLAGEPEAVPEGDPAAIGTPAFLVGGVALGLVNIGYVPATAVGASIPIVVTATGAGQFIAALWAARISQNAVATIFAVFGGFWVSYAALVLGLIHDWYGISPANPADAAAVKETQELFLISWLVVIVLLTLFTLRLPVAFTLLFLLVDVSLLLSLLGVVKTSAALTHASGYVTFAFVAVGVYLFLHGLTTATGGKALSLGRPLLH
jgi:succinate-acetate transporter protein